MEQNEIFDTVKAVVMDVLKIDGEAITMDTRFSEGIKLNPMDQFFLIDGFCEKFDINISDEDARNIHSVGDAVKAIEASKK